MAAAEFSRFAGKGKVKVKLLSCVQPTRLLHPWDFPGKSTRVGCHCLLQIFLLDVAKLDPKQYDIQKKKVHTLVNIHKIKNLNIFPKKVCLENYPLHLINE